jgi:hypothetical protein
MQQEIDYHHSKYPIGTFANIESGIPGTFSAIWGIFTYESCLQELELADRLSSHAILIEPVNEGMTRAANVFVQKNGYMAYKIDGIIRIYKA